MDLAAREKVIRHFLCEKAREQWSCKDNLYRRENSVGFLWETCFMHSHYKCNYSALVHITLISMGSFVPVQKKGQKNKYSTATEQTFCPAQLLGLHKQK